jgi:hypothetical protein
MRDLSRTLCGVHARDAQRVAGLRERHLQLLERADEARDRPQLLRQPRHGVGDLPGVQRVVDAPVPGQVAGQLGGHLLRRRGGDQAQPHVRELCRGGHEPRGGGHQERGHERGVHHGR